MAHGSTGCGAKQGYHSPDAHVPPITTNLLEFFRTIQSIYIQFLRIHCMSYAALTRYLAEKAKGFSKHSLLAYLEHEREETDELFRTLQQQSITFYTTIKGIGNVHAGIKVTGGCLGSASLRARSSTWMWRPQTPPPSPGAAAPSAAGDANDPAPPAANGAATADGGAA